MWCCYWDAQSNLEAEPPMLQHQCFCSPVHSGVGCTCAEKHCSDVGDIFWCEGNNILKHHITKELGRVCNLLLQTKLLVQYGQGEFLFGTVPVFVHWLFGGDNKCHLFLVAVRFVAPSPAVRLFQFREDTGVAHPTSFSPCRTPLIPSCCSVGKMWTRAICSPTPEKLLTLQPTTSCLPWILQLIIMANQM